MGSLPLVTILVKSFHEERDCVTFEELDVPCFQVFLNFKERSVLHWALDSEILILDHAQVREFLTRLMA